MYGHYIKPNKIRGFTLFVWWVAREYGVSVPTAEAAAHPIYGNIPEKDRFKDKAQEARARFAGRINVPRAAATRYAPVVMPGTRLVICEALGLTW